MKAFWYRVVFYFVFIGLKFSRTLALIKQIGDCLTAEERFCVYKYHSDLIMIVTTARDCTCLVEEKVYYYFTFVFHFKGPIEVLSAAI